MPVEALQWAIQSVGDITNAQMGIGGSGGGKGGVKGKAAGVGSLIANMITGGLSGTMQRQAQQKRDVTSAEQRAGASQPAGPLIRTAEERQEIANRVSAAAFKERQRQQEQAAAAAKQRKAIDDQQYHEQRMAEGQQIGLAGIQLAEYSDPEKRTLTQVQKPPVQKDVVITGPDGKDFYGREDPDTGNLTKITGEPLDPTKYQRRVDKPESDKGELELRQQALRDIESGDPIKVQAAKDYLKSLATKEKDAEIRITIAQQNAAQNNAPAAPGLVDYWSNFIYQGGQIPYGELRNLGRKTVSDIMANIPRIAEQRGESVGDLISRQSDVKALGSALSRMESQFATTSAFEKTARANLDRAIASAQHIVDSGSPWVNGPWRAAESQLAGKPEYAAFHAARVVAFTEVSKVLNNPNGQGAVSDSARKEAESALAANATFGQLVAASNILRQDMASRIESMQTTIEEMKRKLGMTGSGGAVTPAASTTPAHTATGPDGKRLKLENGKWVPM